MAIIPVTIDSEQLTNIESLLLKYHNCFFRDGDELIWRKVLLEVLKLIDKRQRKHDKLLREWWLLNTPSSKQAQDRLHQRIVKHDKSKVRLCLSFTQLEYLVVRVMLHEEQDLLIEWQLMPIVEAYQHLKASYYEHLRAD